ncbi:hypothetical protein FAZ95_02020 [Trinickia violacea]|uniref:Uncharacterized protein n=1 Tax=Trinickia violacea TaxID=2571746 RepID=A0A4P8IQ85_9BURK|nr:type IV toxin-antitoxin system AbiEi family antitoxin [Trinickia violacea]QCP48069.1 hypothetical protein FAZ95_02020 [Trinickia violacea]
MGSPLTLVDHFVRTFENATGAAISIDRQFEVGFERPDGQRRLDLLLDVRMPDCDLTLAVEILRQGYPRDVRNAVWQLSEYQLFAKDRGRIAAFVVAEALSPGARQVLREHGIGYFDSSGSLYMKIGDRLIDIDRPQKMSRTTRVTSIFRGAREQVVHTLLHEGNAWLTGLEIAERSATSVYTVSQTLRELEQLEWIVSEGNGRKQRRHLAQPGKLLDAWSESWTSREQTKTRYFMFAANPKQILTLVAERLSEASLENWALTGAAAANALSPLLTSVDTIDLIIPRGSTVNYTLALGLLPVDKGANVTLVERDGASTLFRQQPPDLPAWFASPYIQYLDLQDGRGRNKELADALRSTVLKI